MALGIDKATYTTAPPSNTVQMTDRRTVPMTLHPTWMERMDVRSIHSSISSIHIIHTYIHSPHLQNVSPALGCIPPLRELQCLPRSVKMFAIEMHNLECMISFNGMPYSWTNSRSMAVRLEMVSHIPLYPVCTSFSQISWFLSFHSPIYMHHVCTHPSIHSSIHSSIHHLPMNRVEPHHCKPKTIPSGPNWKIRAGQTQVGTGISGRARLFRCLHESSTRQNGGIHQWAICRYARGGLDSVQQCTLHSGCDGCFGGYGHEGLIRMYMVHFYRWFTETRQVSGPVREGWCTVVLGDTK